MKRYLSSLLIALLMVITLIYPVMANVHACCSDPDTSVMMDVLEQNDTDAHPCCVSSAVLPTFIASTDNANNDDLGLSYPPASSYFDRDFNTHQAFLGIQANAIIHSRHVADESRRHARLCVFLN